MPAIQQILTFPMLVLLWIWISSIFLSYIVANEKDRSGSNWAAAAVFMGLLALLAVVGLPRAEPRYNYREEPELPPKLQPQRQRAERGRPPQQGRGRKAS